MPLPPSSRRGQKSALGPQFGDSPGLDDVLWRGLRVESEWPIPRDMSSTGGDKPTPEGVFATTHWSLVIAAGGPSSTTAAEALASLCRAYWYPLYAHIRRRGNDVELARDLTQELFADLLARGAIARVQEDKGRFRSFLMKAADNHLHRAHRDAQTQKRGGGAAVISFDSAEGEERLSLESDGELSPDAAYDRRWAMTTLEVVRKRTRAEFAANGRIELFDLLRPHLFGDAEALPYDAISRQTGMSVGAIKQTTFRLRQRFGELLRTEVAETLVDGASGRSLVLTNLSTAHAGSYTVTVSNPAGSITSEPAVLDVDTQFTFLSTSPVSRDFAWGPSWVDYDGDGLLDLYAAGDSGHLLYHNEGDGTFTKVGRTNAIVARSYPQGSVGAGYWADYDGDGLPDLFTPVGWGNGFERNQLFRGLGSGRFLSVTIGPVGQEMTEGISAAWADFNRDGILDLFVANLATDPTSSKPIRNTLYLGQPGGTFVRWRPPGFEAVQSRNYGCAVGDFNGDGYPDIALALRQNGVLMNVVLFNLAGKDFEPVVLNTGGSNYGGIAAGDFDNNGALDLFQAAASGLVPVQGRRRGPIGPESRPR